MGEWRERAGALGVSAAAHAIAVGGAMVLVFGGASAQSVDSTHVDRERVENVSFFVPAYDDSPEIQTLDDVSTIDIEPPVVDAIDAALDALLEMPEGVDGSDLGAFESTGAADVFGASAADAWGAPTGVHVPTTVTLAGSTARDARDVVYVVDASGSMVSSMPMVQDVLARSLGGLRPTQRFALLFITRDGYSAYTAGAPGSSVRLLRATRDEVSLAADWMRSVRAGGLGNPLPALEAALDLSPDAIFVLSKGIEPPEGVEPTEAQILSALDRGNPVRSDGTRRIAINAIQIIREDRADALWSLAQIHGAGRESFLFVSREELESYAKGVAP